MSDDTSSREIPARSGPPGLRLARWPRRPPWLDLGTLSWPFLSRISPVRRAGLLAVAIFELWEANRLWQAGLLDRNWVALTLGFLVLLLLLGYEMAEHAAMRRDSDLCKEIADWLLPQTPLSVPGFYLAFASRRADQVGSDYFNAYPRSGHADAGERIFLVMADVAGSGMQGALLMATFQASLRALVDSRIPLAELTALMNHRCWNRSIGGKHFTMAFFADLDLHDGSLAYVTAGHQPPVVQRAGGGIERLDRGGFPLGALSDSDYDLGRSNLDPGDALVIFTDGVVEAMDRREERFGEDRLLHSLLATRGLPADRVLEHLRSSVLSYAGLQPQGDDISFLVLTRNH